MVTHIDHDTESVGEDSEETTTATARVLSAILEDIRNDGQDE